MSGLSYAHVPADLPLIYKSFPDSLDQHAENTPDKDAYVFWSRPDESSSDRLRRQAVSFSSLARSSIQLAASLLTFGLKPGDRVAVFGRPSPEWLNFDLASLRIKVLLVRLPQSLVYSGKLSEFLTKFRCRALYIDAEPQSKIFEQIRATLPGVLERSTPGVVLQRQADQYPEFVVSARRSILRVLTIDDLVQANNTDLSRAAVIQKTIDPDEVALVFPTSGSSGVPKLVAHSTFSVVNSYPFQTTEYTYLNDRLFTWCGSFFLMPVICGNKYVNVETSVFDDNIGNLFRIAREEAVVMLSVPVYLGYNFVEAMESGVQVKPPSLIGVAMSGERIPRTLSQRLLKFIPLNITAYAATECNPVCVETTTAALADATTENNQVQTESETQALGVKKGVQVKLTDPENGSRVLPVDQPGCIWVRSPLTAAGYLDDPERTAELRSPSGWWKTGDMGVMTAERKVRILGRAIEIISKGSIKVYPSTIESVISRHPAVASVFVTGVPDEKFNEEVGACVIPEQGSDVTADQIRQFCEENMDTRLGVSFVPKYIMIVEQFPKLPSGKIDRVSLKATLKVSGK